MVNYSGRKNSFLSATAKNQKLRSALAVGALIGGIGVACYYSILAPYVNPGPWREVQMYSRKGLDVEKIQPGGMKVWSDPFDKKK